MSKLVLVTQLNGLGYSKVEELVNIIMEFSLDTGGAL